MLYRKLSLGVKGELQSPQGLLWPGSVRGELKVAGVVVLVGRRRETSDEPNPWELCDLRQARAPRALVPAPGNPRIIRVSSRSARY